MDKSHQDVVSSQFHDRLALLSKLTVSDSDFHDICEEYALARESLARFENRPDAAERPEIKEYRVLVAELEADIARRLEGEENDTAG